MACSGVVAAPQSNAYTARAIAIIARQIGLARRIINKVIRETCSSQLDSGFEQYMVAALQQDVQLSRVSAATELLVGTLQEYLCYWGLRLRFLVVGDSAGLEMRGKLRMSWTRCTFCSNDFAVWMKFRMVGEVSSLRQVVWTSIMAWGSRNGRIARRSAKEGCVGFFPTARKMPLPEAVIMAPASS